MANEEKINFDIEAKGGELEELSLDNLSSSWIKNPKVGEEIVIDIKKIFKDNNIIGTTSEGKTFKTNLSGVNYKITIETTDGKKYSPGAWEVWGKLKALMLEKKSTQIKTKIKHTRDGQVEKDNKENYEVTLVE